MPAIKSRLERLERIASVPSVNLELMTPEQRYLWMLDQPSPFIHTTSVAKKSALSPEEAYKRMIEGI